MCWTNMNEKEIIVEWAKKESSKELASKYLSMPEFKIRSYWCKYGNGNEIIDYDFETVSDLKELLEQELEEDFYKDLYLPLAVAAFKERRIVQTDIDICEDNSTSKIGIEEFSIPDFVYIF